MPNQPPTPSRRRTQAAKLAQRRLRRSLSVLYDAARAGDTVAGVGIEAEDAWVLLQGSMFLRGINAIKVSRLLTLELQWEFAAAAARQVFELVVTAEYIRAQPDPRLTAIQFARFGSLRQILARLEEMDYAEQTGRVIDREHRKRPIDFLDDFEDLRTGKNRGWPRSWSGLTTRRIAELSPRQPVRTAQYRQLFTAWSEQIHASPAALLPGVFPAVEPNYEDLLADDLSDTSEVATMTVILFVELWEILPAIPDPKMSKRRD